MRSWCGDADAIFASDRAHQGSSAIRCGVALAHAGLIDALARLGAEVLDSYREVFASAAVCELSV